MGMAKYRYTAIDPSGVSVKGVEEAVTLGQVRAVLRHRGFDVVDVSEKRNLLRLEITKTKVPRKEIMHFSRQMAVFVRAGIPLIDGLEVIAEDTTDKTFRKVLLEMGERLRAGSTFADAAEEHPYAFPTYYLGILRSAELTGNLDIVLDQLATYIDRDLEARNKIVSALIYPAVVVGMAIVAVIVLVSYVLPKFQEFFDNLDADLPLPTRILISFAEFIGNWWWLILGVPLAAIVAVILAMRSDTGKLWRDRVLLKLPVLGDVVRFAVLERFCRILSSMVSAGVPLPDALAVTSDATNNAVYQRELATAREAMLQGEGLATPLTSTGLFPGAARQMFRVGEDTGTLDDQLEAAATYFDRELDYKLKRFTGLFEPLIIIMVGVVVGFVAIALVSAMYGIFNQVEV
jgi:type IV pilus assembly protein PilC